MPQAASTQQPGLWTSPNPYLAPQGALAVADNCVIRNAGILEPRRGNLQHSALASGSRLTSYLGTLIALAGTTLKKYTGSWVAFTGSFSPPDASNPVRFLSAANYLLFTTSAGVQLLDGLTGTPRRAGQPRAPYPGVSPGGSGTWLPVGSSVAYVTCFGSVDSKGNIRLGTPSGANALTNGGAGATSPIVNVVLSTAITAGMVAQVYRTQTAATTPSSDFFLVWEKILTAADITAGQFIFNDLEGDTELGQALYTNQGQEGQAQENDQPPISRDLCLFKNTIIYANTTDRHRAEIIPREVQTATGILIGDTVQVSVNGGGSVTLTGSTTNSSTTFVANSTALAAANGIYRELNANAALSSILVDYLPTTPQPTVLLEELGIGGNGWVVTYGTTTFAIPTGGMSRSTTVVTVTQNNHPYVVGCYVNVQPQSTLDPNFPAGVKQVVSITTNTWSYTEVTGTASTSVQPYNVNHDSPWEGWVGALSTVAGTVPSTNSADPAGLTFSEANQPEATPLEQSETVGDASQPVLRVIPLRNSVLIFKPDGIYQLTGNSPADFQIQPYDLTTQLLWPESLVAMDDAALFMSQRGPSGMSESGGAYPLAPAGLDCPERDAFLSIAATCAINAPTTAFGIAYAAERLYILWTPTLSSDTLGTQSRVFSTANNAWTRWPYNAAHGIIDPATGKLTLVDGVNVLQERKSFNDTDYQDIGGSANITNVANSTTITMAGPGVGDLITQGVNSARVLSVAGGNVLTLDTAGTWTTSSANYARAITSTVTLLPWAGVEQNPGEMHKFEEFNFNFRKFTGNWIFATTATDMDVSPDPIQEFGRPSQPLNVNIRVGLNRDYGSGIMLQMGMVIAQAVTSWQLQSVSLVSEGFGTRLPRQTGGPG